MTPWSRIRLEAHELGTLTVYDLLRLATEQYTNGLADPIFSCNMDEVTCWDASNWNSQFDREESFIGLKVLQDEFRTSLSHELPLLVRCSL